MMDVHGSSAAVPVRRSAALFALLGTTAAAATLVGYLGLVGVGALAGSRVSFVATYILLAGACGVAGVVLIRRGQAGAARLLLRSAATGMVGLGVLAIFSIGLAMLITAGLLLWASGLAADAAADRLPLHGRGMHLVATVLAPLGLLAFGFAVTR
jgi:hypothetical protein